MLIFSKVADRASGEFARVQDLARRLALNLGVDVAKNREAVINIHRYYEEFFKIL